MRGILILCAVLLAGEVWAGPSITTADCKLYYDAKGSLHSTCEHDELIIDPGQPVLSNSYYACHQRMQEAMKAMDEQMDRDKPVVTDKQVTMSFNMEKDRESWKLWRSTMRDCVTGK